MAPILARRPAADRAFERLYRHHSRDVYRYALALLRDPTEAEDATQTAFMNAYRALVRGEQPNSPKAWLLAIVHNVCRMRRRTLARRPREVPLDDHPIPAVDDERPRLDVVLAALAELPLNQRAALVMREVEGRSYQEISDVLGVTISAVEALIFRARRRLRVRRDALGVIAVAPVPASLSVFPGTGVVATALGSDLMLKAAAGFVAALLAGGAAYQATTGGQAATPQVRGHAPAIRRVLVASEVLAPRAVKAHRPRSVAPGRATHTGHAGDPAATAARLRTHAPGSIPIARRIVAPVRTHPIAAPPARAQHTAAPTHVSRSRSHPVALPQVPVPRPPVELPPVQAPRLPPANVPAPPPLPTLPNPPPVPKIP